MAIVYDIHTLDRRIQDLAIFRDSIIGVELTAAAFRQTALSASFDKTKAKILGLLYAVPTFSHHIIDVEQHQSPDTTVEAYKLFIDDTFPCFFVIYFDTKTDSIVMKRTTACGDFNNWFNLEVIRRFNLN